MLCIEPEGLRLMARQAFLAFSFVPSISDKVAKILSDPEASENDKFVALTMLRNAETSAKENFPFARIQVLRLFLARKGNMFFHGRR